MCKFGALPTSKCRYSVFFIHGIYVKVRKKGILIGNSGPTLGILFGFGLALGYILVGDVILVCTRYVASY